MSGSLTTAILWWRRLLDTAAALLLCAITGLTFARVVGRYALGTGLPWSEELVRLLFVWLIMIGAVRCAHLQIDIVTAALPPRGRKALGLVASLLGIGLLAFLVWQNAPLIELTRDDYYTALGVSLSYLYYSLAVGGVMWIIGLVLALIAPEATDEQAPT